MANDWKSLNLNEVSEYINRGIPPVYTQDNSGTVVINQKCIRDGQVNFELSRLTDESFKKIPREKILQPYDILINSTGTGTVGRVGQVMDLSKRATVDTHVTIVRPKRSVIDPIFLGYWMKMRQEELEGLAGGSTNQVELSRAKIAEVNVVVPSLDVQKKIANTLMEIDSQLELNLREKELLLLLKKGIMQDIFNQKVKA